jgi:hypothetical protein
MTERKRNNHIQKTFPWVPMAKDTAKLLPADRPFTEVEALFSLQLDHNNSHPVTIAGYSKRWDWTRDGVRSFLKKCGLSVKYPYDTHQVQKQVGQLIIPTDQPTENPQIKFIDFNRLKGQSHRKSTDDPTLLTRNKRKRKKEYQKDPRVSVFSAWFCEKFKRAFERDYHITNWGKHGAQIKQLLSMPLSWEDLQYITIEFLLDEDPFLEEKGGHNVGILLMRIGQNVYRRYLDRDFREKNADHITSEPVSAVVQDEKQGRPYDSSGA